MQVDQSSITGESLAVQKRLTDTVYQSSTIKRGEGYMMITATGDNTFVGRSAALVNAAAANVGHFTQIIRGIGTALLVLVILTLFVVWVSSFYRSNPIVQILSLRSLSRSSAYQWVFQSSSPLQWLSVRHSLQRSAPSSRSCPLLSPLLGLRFCALTSMSNLLP